MDAESTAKAGAPHVAAAPGIPAALLLESMTEGVSLSTEDGVIVYTNPAEDALFGYAPGELIGQHVSVQNAYDDEENRQVVDAVMAQLRASGSWEGEWQNRRKDGSAFHTSARITTVMIEGQRHWLCVQRDITEARRFEAELARSEERLRLATEGTGVGTYDLDMSTGMGTWSRTAFELLGLPPREDLSGSYREWRARVHPDDVAGLEAEHRNGEAAGRTWRSAYRVIRQDNGETHWLETFGRFIHQPDGSVRSTGAVTDITERRRAEAAVRESEELLQLVIDSLPALVSYIDHEGRYRLVNRTYEEWFGTSRDQIVGRHMRELLGEEAYALRAGQFEAVLRGEPQTFEAFTQRADGERRATEMTYRPRRGADGSVVGFFVLVIDVTERRRTEEAIAANERRMRAVLEAVSDAFFAVDGEWRITLLNGRAEAFFQVTRDEALGRSIWDVIPEGRDTPVEEALREAMETGAAVTYEGVSFRRHDRYVVMRVAPKEGGGLAASFSDITDGKRAEMALRESEARFREVADSAPVLIWMSGPDALCTWFNRSWRDFTGRSLEQDVGVGWLDGVHPDDRERCMGVYRQHFDRRAPFSMDYRLRRADGEYRVIYDTGVPRTDPEGAFHGYIGSCIDVTDSRRAEAEMQRMNSELEMLVAARTEQLERAQEALRQSQKLEALGQLTGGIAHDFNNLLAAVVGSLDLLQRLDELGPRARRYVENALAGANRGARLTAQLLAFSRAQRLELRPVRVADVVTGMHELIARTIGPSIRVELDLADEDALALSDSTQLEMALLNICINARDAMPEGGALVIATRSRRLEADAELPDGAYIEIAVRDTGTGMSPEVLARALDPFFTTKGVGKGTGLGLSQAYGLARQSGGTLRIESAIGDGTTVRLLLSCTGDIGERSAADAGESRGVASRAADILVVDDDAEVRRVLVETLEVLGYSVRDADDAAAGLRLMEARTPDLMLVDFAMPGMNGAELAQAARARVPALPIVLVSGYADTAAINTLVPDVPMVRKPFRVEELRRAIEAALQASGEGPEVAHS